MAIHDAYPRITPYELALPDPEEAGTLMDRVDAEAEEAGGVDDLQGFMLLGSVGRFLRDLRPAEAHGEALHQYASLAYHVWRFHRAGRPFWLLTTHAARYLVDGSPAPGPPTLPEEAGYLQLPRHLFWVQPGPDEAPEPVDGFFWHRSAAGVFHVLLAMGIREGRAGLGVVPVADAPWADAGRWLDASVRPDGEDFATTLPGGELEGLYSLAAAGEPLKLLARTFAYLDRFPDAVSAAEPREPDEAAEGAPLPSRLSARVIRLETGG
jgi:hypothetical protein